MCYIYYVLLVQKATINLYDTLNARVLEYVTDIFNLKCTLHDGYVIVVNKSAGRKEM